MKELESPLYELTEPDISWRDNAACKRTDVNLFMSKEKGAVKEALALCAGCLVVKDCLNFAMTNNITHGIWGGKTERQRKSLKRAKNLEVRVLKDSI